MASWFDLKGTFQEIFKIGGKNKTAIDVSDPSELRFFYMPDSEVDLRGGTEGQVLLQTSGNTIGWSDNFAEAISTRVFNHLGTTVAKGKVVYLNGRQGDRPRIALAQANAEVTADNTYGLVYDDILSMEDGLVISQGIIRGLNTDIVGWTEGDTLWLSATTAGGITNVEPLSPNRAISIGTLVRKHQNEGIIAVRIQIGYELGELFDVSIPTTPSDGQVLTYETSSQLWKAKTPTGGGGGSGYTEIAAGGSIAGTYNGEVYCMGNVSLAGNVTVKGNMYVTGNVVNSNGYDLTVNGDLTVSGSLDFTKSLDWPEAGETGELNVKGDCSIGYQITDYKNSNFTVFKNFETSIFSFVNLPYRKGFYILQMDVIPSTNTFTTDFKPNSRITINGSPDQIFDLWEILPSSSTASSSINTIINPNEFELVNFASVSKTYEELGISAGDTVTFDSGVLTGESGVIQSINGNVVSFAPGTFTGVPDQFDNVIITVQNGIYSIRVVTTNYYTNDQLQGFEPEIEYTEFKSVLFREKETTDKPIIVGGDFSCYRLDVSASGSSFYVRGKNVEIGGNLTLKSFQEDCLGFAYYDFILLQGSAGCEANSLIVRGSVYNGSIFGKAWADSTTSNSSQSSNVQIYGDCILTVRNAFRTISGFVELSSEDSSNVNPSKIVTGGSLFVGGNFVGSAISVNGSNTFIIDGGNFAGSSGNVTIMGSADLSVCSSISTQYPDASQTNSIGGTTIFGNIELRGGSSNTAANFGGDGGYFFCAGDVNGTIYTNNPSDYMMVYSRGGDNNGGLGKIVIYGNANIKVVFQAGDSYGFSVLANESQNIYTSDYENFGFPVQGARIYVGGDCQNVELYGGRGLSAGVAGGSIGTQVAIVKGNIYGSLIIDAGDSDLATGGSIEGSCVVCDGVYIESISAVSGSGTTGGSFSQSPVVLAQIATINSLALYTGSGTTGRGGAFSSFNLNANISNSIDIRVGGTSTSTATMSEATISIRGDISVQTINVRNASASSSGGIANAGINLTIIGDIQLRNNGLISLIGGSSVNQNATKPPKLIVNGSINARAVDASNQGIVIEAGSTSSGGNAVNGSIPAQTLYVEGNVTIGRLLATGGRLGGTNTTGTQNAGSIADEAIYILGKITANVVTLTGGQFSPTVGVTASQKAGDAGTIAAGGFSVRTLTCNGGSLTSVTAARGSAGGFKVITTNINDASYIGTFNAADSSTGAATTVQVLNILAGHIIIDNWNLPTRTTYLVKCNGVPTSLIVRSFTGKQKLANSSNVETTANLAADSMYFSTGTTWRSVTNAAFV